jgi:hypothetical protein
MSYRTFIVNSWYICGSHQRSHAPSFRLLAAAPGDLAPDLVVKGEDVVDDGRVLDLPPSHVVLRRVDVVRALGSESLV